MFSSDTLVTHIFKLNIFCTSIVLRCIREIKERIKLLLSSGGNICIHEQHTHRAHKNWKTFTMGKKTSTSI